MKRLKIEALAKSVPEMRVSNDDLAEFIETSDEWISQRTGIKTRRVSLFDNTSDLCAKAAKELLSKTSTEASEIDLIIVATMTRQCNAFDGCNRSRQDRRKKCGCLRYLSCLFGFCICVGYGSIDA